MVAFIFLSPCCRGASRKEGTRDRRALQLRRGLTHTSCCANDPSVNKEHNAQVFWALLPATARQHVVDNRCCVLNVEPTILMMQIILFVKYPLIEQQSHWYSHWAIYHMFRPLVPCHGLHQHKMFKYMRRMSSKKWTFCKTLFVIFCAVVLLTFRGCRNTHLWWMVRNLLRLEQHGGFFATNPFFLWQIHSSQNGEVDFLFCSPDNLFDTFLKIWRLCLVWRAFWSGSSRAWFWLVFLPNIVPCLI